MSLVRSLIVGTAVATAALSIAAPASAVVTTFATYSSSTSAANLYWKKSGTSGGNIFTTATKTATTAGSAAVNFEFLQPALASLGVLKSSFTFNGHTDTSNAASLDFGYLIQPITSGTFSFIYSGVADLTVNNTVYHTNAILLSGTFTKAAIVGANGATSGAASGSTNPADANGPVISYYSDFLDFSSSIEYDFSLGLTSITSALNQATTGSSLRTFRANSGGSFSSNPAPTVSAVPEPGVWAMLIVGFSLVGLRSRKRQPLFVAS